MSHRVALLAQADALAAQAAALRALAESLPHVEVDASLTLAQIREAFGFGEEAVRAAIARGELSATRGPRQRIEVRRSEIERWRSSRPVHLKPKKRVVELDHLEAWERETGFQLAGAAR